ncbi:energy-coupling factor ABC transporter ATP-binding protein [bacterium]
MINFKNINFKYSGESKYLLNNVSFSVNHEEIVLIQGKNGSGKTTLIKMLLGLISPLSGEITINDKMVSTEIDDIIHSSYIGYVFTNPDIHIVNEAVFEEIAFSMENKGFAQEEINTKIDEVLKSLGIMHLKYSIYETLSKYERKLVSLSSVLVYEPMYLILDDPTCWLDEQSTKKFMSACEKYIKKGNRSILIISHHADMIYSWWNTRSYKVKHYVLENKTLREKL